MAKPKQRSGRHKKDQSGCMWGIINMFDFRHGRATRRLLSDRRRNTTNETHGSLYPASETNLATSSQKTSLNTKDGENVQKPSFDIARSRVKELIEEELFVDQNKSATKDHEHGNISKTLKNSFDQEISNNHQVSSQKTSQYRDIEALVREMLLIYQKKNERNGDFDPGAKQSFPMVEEKLIAAVEALLNDKSTNGNKKKNKNHHSKEMFQILSSNKELFFKLIQDQNAILINEDQKSKSKSNLLETETDQETEEQPVTRKHRKFFRRRSKSQETIPLNGKDRIVILQPGSSEYQAPVVNEIHNSNFSFMEIKRRLKNAMGKDPRTPGPTQRTGKTVVDGGWSSPNRDHFYTERFARFSKLRESETKHETPNHQISNIYVEAKKHLSEMLTSGDEDAESMMRSLPKSLGGILALRDYNSLSPSPSPRIRTRHSSCEDISMVNKSQLLTTIDSAEGKVAVLVPDDMTSQGVQETVKSPSRDNKKHKEQTTCEPCISLKEDRSTESLELELQEENDLSSSSTADMEPSAVSKTDELEFSPGKPSPISVLDPLFSDDDITPARTISRPVEAAIQPLCIQFEKPVSCTEDPQIRITDSGDTEESAFEYVEAVLLSSDLNWSEFETRWLSSTQILDPSLFSEVETFSSRPKHDQKLLFDSATEALEEICNRVIPESSVVKRDVWPVPKGMDLINEVWARVEMCLCKVYPRDLARLVRSDLETSRMWLDLRVSAREIVNEIEELIFDETIYDTLSSLFDNGVDILDNNNSYTQFLLGSMEEVHCIQSCLYPKGEETAFTRSSSQTLE